ncbi:hypothetical protein EOL96_01725 [Candidatus Saccharibacteria bacterium]|nr:hypothetical protein [Candidatus Saccharibacteria bacterium]
MQKDVIYIDVEDDITAIIGKVKAASHKVVALVPPKRIGAIQSAVNLKLVHRAAGQSNKRLVIISNNAALTALAGSAGIPVSKNLQSKPELAQIPAIEIDEGDDVIDGADLPIGEHVAMGERVVDDTLAPAVGAAAVAASSDGVTRSSDAKSGLRNAKSTVKVPNFDTFRKKLVLIGLGLLLLVGVLVWAIAFAPNARVIITARTADVALNSRVTMASAVKTDLNAGTIKSNNKTIKKDVSLPFTATGKKDVGEKATGEVTFTNVSFSAVTVTAGTVLTSNTSGLQYTTTSSVTVPKGSCTTIFNCTAGTATGGVVAVENGTTYNGDTGSLSGAGNGLSSEFASATGGGTTREVTVVTQEDIDKVSGDIAKTDSSTAAREELIAQFGSSFVVLESTLKVDSSAVTPNPAVNAEAANGKGTLSGQVVYTITGVPKVEIANYLDGYFKQQIDGRSDQKIYNNGLDEVSFTNISLANDGVVATISTNGKIGPKIDETSLKEYAKGKRYGEIQSYVEQIEGVDNVDVKFAPFWVSTAPDDSNRIKVEFKVNGS